MADDDLWRKRLFVYSALRAIGVGIFFLGVAIIYTNLLRLGGWPQVGAAIAIVGAVNALLVPHFVKRGWDRQDRDGL